MKKQDAIYLGNLVRSTVAYKQLDKVDAERAFTLILEDNTPLADFYWGSLFSAVQARGPKLHEIDGFLEAAAKFDKKLRLEHGQKMVIPTEKPVVAITGSGKDTWKTFNVSTTASFIAASCGACVVKPGSSATSSMTGAVQILDCLDIPQVSDLKVAQKIAEETGLTIVNFANTVPRYAKRYDNIFHHFHPLSYVMPIVAIPFKTDAVVYGIADENVDFSLQLINKYGPANAAVVATKRAEGQITDELLPFGEGLFAVSVNGKRFSNRMYNPVPQDIDRIGHGTSHKENAQKVLEALSDDRTSPLTQAASMAAASMLVTAGLSKSLDDAYEMALQAVESKRAMAKLNEYKQVAINCTSSPSNSLTDKFAKTRKQETIAVASQKAHDQISMIKEQYGYADITEDCSIDHLDHEYLASKFSCHDDLHVLSEVPPEKRAIITGFGPTNSPTAGTLSVILKTIALQRETGYDTEIIISNLGAYLSRNAEWDFLDTITKRFVHFIHASGFDTSKGRVRTHIDKENLGIGTFINENALTAADFNANKEATEELYGAMNLLGSRMGIMTDSTYTVADCVKPLFKDSFVKAKPHNKERVLVVAGIEEHYFPRLSKVAIDRINSRFPGQYIAEDAKVCAMYTKLIPGMAPYPKMSKSIPDSAINIGDPKDVIRDKIMSCSPENERVILEMMAQASNWTQDKVKVAISSFGNKDSDPASWHKLKEDYTTHFIEIADRWHEACKKYPLPDGKPDEQPKPSIPVAAQQPGGLTL